MIEVVDRITTVAKAAVTWLVALAGVLTIVAEELTTALGADSAAVAWIVRIVAWLGIAITIIRRSTPVLPAARGILPKPGEPATVAEREYLDAWLKQIQ
jgi:hypothetical protein